MASGKVMTLRTNPRVALRKPMTTAAIMADWMPVMKKPGTMRATSIKEIAARTQ